MEFIIGIILLSMFMRVVMNYFISKKGWTPLAKQFTTTEEVDGETLKFVSMGIGKGIYKHLVFLTYNEEGLHLRVFYVFNAFHPPLFIPWSEIHYDNIKNPLSFKRSSLLIGSPTITDFKISDYIYQKLKPYIGKV